VRKDTLSMFYAKNYFTMRLQIADLTAQKPTLETEVLNRWLKAIGSRNTKHIQNFTVKYASSFLTSCRITLDQVMAEEGLALVADVASYVQQ